MEDILANILLRQSWNNLVDLPSNTVNLLYNANISPQDVIIELSLSPVNRIYLGWSGMNSSSITSLGVDPVAAQSLKLKQGQVIKFTVIIQKVKSSNIQLEPESFADWELVELHAQYIESKLIQQSRCVALNQTLVVYATKTSAVKLKVKSVGIDSPFALIDPFAEVSIAPKVQKDRATQSRIPVKNTLSVSSPTMSYMKRGVSTPSSLFPHSPTVPVFKGYEIYGDPREFHQYATDCEFVTVSVLACKQEDHSVPQLSDQRETEKDLNKSTSNMKFVESRKIVARFVACSEAPKDTVGLSEKLAVALRVENCVGYKVVLKSAQDSLCRKPSAFVIHPYIANGKKNEHLSLISSKKIRAEICHEVSKVILPDNSESSPISNFCRIPVIERYLPHGGILVFKKNLNKHAWTKPSSVDLNRAWPRVELGENIPNSHLLENMDLDETAPLPMYGAKCLLDNIIEHFGVFKNTGVMIHGAHGSGKSAVLKTIAKTLQDHLGVFTIHVACETLMTEPADQICLQISEWAHQAVWNQPSILILDNLDTILSADVENTDSSKPNQLTEFFVKTISNACFQKGTSISALVSGTSKESFNKLIAQSHVFEKHFNLSAPDKSQRATILNAYLSDYLGQSLTFDVMDVVSETEGYMANDLKMLSDRMCHESLRPSHANTSGLDVHRDRNISQADYKRAISGFKPSNLRGVKLEQASTHWKEIGGMFDAKRVLLETLDWPTKYAPIFANCPLRLRSGLLLFGYPGCGKTMLASAIAGQCGLNFISVKGPEILNKYIGASEQAVRELFERAQSAKPCILFFDEFDSIAPKRGHDSTGVTDRVVNQMLTQMDGAEGLDGVYVLAATSRPDLIDSALLRPGRLDKSVFCDMPNYFDRLGILSCVCEKMNLLKDVRLEDIASQTEGYSGADLQGLGYNAYLKAVHEKLSDEEGFAAGHSDEFAKGNNYFMIDSTSTRSKITLHKNASLSKQIENLTEMTLTQKNSTKVEGNPVMTQVSVSNSHFMDSLRDSKLSISVSEKKKLNKIYTEFLTGRDGIMPDGGASHEIGGRTTLM
mgnify:FL=1